jgi:uncharacterized delta-60 repeat protein
MSRYPRLAPEAAPRTRVPLRLEALEQRLLLDAGALDPLFGVGGVFTYGSTGYDDAADVAVQADGKLVVAGAVYNYANRGYDMLVFRLNPDGTPDETFGTDGTVTFDLQRYDVAKAVAVDGDGRIVVSGTTARYDDRDFAVFRLNPDGTVDTSFGTDGVTVFNVSPSPRYTADFVTCMDIAPDGRIVVGGYADISFVDKRYAAAVAVLTPEGLLDTTFGGDGIVVAEPGSTVSYGRGVAVLPDGGIVLGGSLLTPYGSYDGFVIKYADDGSPDPSFGVGGLVVVDVQNTYDMPMDLAVQADGKVVVTGYTSGSGYGTDFLLFRLNSDGSRDAGFGDDGVVLTDFGTYSDFGLAVAVQPDGQIVAAGYVFQSGYVYATALARYNPDGTLDEGFGDGGRVIEDLAAGYERPEKIAIDPAGGIIVAGYANNPGTSYDATVARFEGGLSDTIPPEALGAEVGADLQTITVQFNDDDLDAARATDLANYSLVAANGDADEDGDPFNDGDEVAVGIGSVAYDPVTDAVTLTTPAVIYNDAYRLVVDGDDAAADGTAGLTDIAGNYLAGGDYTVVFDLRAAAAVEDLVTDISELDLPNNVSSSLLGPLDSLSKQLEKGAGSTDSALAHLETFVRQVEHWFEKGRIDEATRDDLIAAAEQMILGLEATGV